MIDFRVETFLCVCRHMSFTRAAEERHITQSAVSQQMRYMEDYYGVKLFRYERRTLSLTPAGERLRRSMEAMVSDGARIRDALREEGGAPLRIGVTMTVGDYFLPPYLAGYLRRHPDGRMTVTRQDTRQIMTLLDAGQLDFALVEGYVHRDAYAVRTLREDDIIAVRGACYPMAAVHSLPELFRHPVLMREEGSGTREVFEQYLLQHGYGMDSFASCVVCNSPTLIRALVTRGCGISVMYRAVAAEALAEGSLREIEIPGFHLSHEFSAVWRRDSLFAEEYKQVLGDLFGA